MIILVNMVEVSRGAGPTIEHWCNAENNEAVMWRRGGPEGIKAKFSQARKFGRLNAGVQIIVNSYEDLPWEMFEAKALPRLAAEFPNLDFSDADIVEHAKEKLDPEASKHHYHVFARAFDEDTGRPVRLSHPYPRVEKVSRILEHDLGFAFVKGPNLDSIIPRLRAEGRTDVADALRATFPPVVKQAAHSFSPAVLQQVKRLVKQHYKDSTKKDAAGAAAAPEVALSALRAGLAPHGIAIDVGPYVPPRWIVIKDDQVIGKLAGMTGEKIDVVENKLGSPADADHREPANREAEPGGPGEPTPVWDDLEYARIVDAAHAAGGDRATPAVPDAGERDPCADFVAELQRRGKAIAAVAEEAENQAVEPIVRLNRAVLEIETAARHAIAAAEAFEHPEGFALKGTRRDIRKAQEKEARITRRLGERTQALQSLQKLRMPSIFRPIKRWRHKRALTGAHALVDLSTATLQKAQQARRDAKERLDFWIAFHNRTAAEARKPLDEAARQAERDLRVCKRAREIVKNDPLLLRYSAAGVFAIAHKDIDRWDHLDVEHWERGSDDDVSPSFGPAP
jgi:hypothetical protein